MRHLRTVIIFVVVAACSVVFAQPGKTPSAHKRITIGIIGKQSTSPVFIASHTGAKLAAKELGATYGLDISIDWQTPSQESAEEQAKAIRRFIRSGVSGIAIACTDATLLTPVINTAVENGIPVMCFNSDAPKSKRFAFFGANDDEFGRMLVRELAAVLNGRGTIAVLAGYRGADNVQQRLQGVKEELSKFPGLELAPGRILYSPAVPSKAADIVNAAQKKNPEIKGWIFIGSTALQVKNSLKWKPGEVKVVAGNAIPSQCEYVQNGYVQSLVAINSFQLGYQSVVILIDKIHRQKSPADPTMFAPLTAITKDNVDEWSVYWKQWLLKENR